MEDLAQVKGAWQQWMQFVLLLFYYILVMFI